MLYAATTFWLLVIVFAAWGVHALWSQLVRPKAVNAILLPGTLVAQLGHVLGILVTGNSVRNTALMGNNESGDPETDTPQETRVPVVGAVVIGMLPLLACGAALYAAARMWGRDVLAGLAPHEVAVAQSLPTSVGEVWALLHATLDLTANLLQAILNSDFRQWQTGLFLYLAVCLTVRMTPFEGNRRGALIAILLGGLLITVIGFAWSGLEPLLEQAWPLLSFAVGMVLFLLLVSLLVSGLVGFVRILAKGQ